MMAEFELSPWGEVAGDYRSAVMGMGIAKAALGHAISGEDFSVKFGSNKQTPDEMLAVMRGIAQRAKGGA